MNEPATTPPQDAPLALSVGDVDALDIVVVMRFSFFGHSGWKSDASRSDEILFEEDRLALRLKLLKHVALASLAAQDDQNFHLFILTSRDLPAAAKAELDASCAGALAPDQYSIMAARPAPAKKHLAAFLKKRYRDAPVVQVVLDDDDGLASDFISRLRQEMRDFLPARTADMAGPAFISFSNGYGMSVQEDVQIFRHRYPYINLGLSMLSRATGKNILAINHRNAPKRFGCRLSGEDPMWVRSVHAVNDSRVEVTARWKPVEDWINDPELNARFSYLRALHPSCD